MQDPFKPVDNDQMIAQMASFSTVDGIGKLNDEIVSKQCHDVRPSTAGIGTRWSQGVDPNRCWQYFSRKPNDERVISTPIKSLSSGRVEDEKRTSLATFKVDGSDGGNVDVNWDGLDKNGQPVVAGNYTIKASGFSGWKSQNYPFQPMPM